MKKILIIAPYYEPAFKFGGPIRSIKNLTEILANEFQFFIVTRDTDFGEMEQFKDVTLGQWNNIESNTQVFYIDSSRPFKQQLKTIAKVGEFDVLYLNSFFDFQFSMRFYIQSILLRRLNIKKVVLAPRGELSKGAMSIKRSKKSVYLFFYKLLNCHKKVSFQFTAHEELEEAQKFLGIVKSSIVPNMHEKIPKFSKKRKKQGDLTLGFLARISVKKNLITALKALKKITQHKVQFQIAGLKEDFQYWNECQNLIKELPSNISVEYLGALPRDEIKGFLENTQAFILPTFNENYGHSIVEAMINSNIVILSDQTPWNDVAKFGSFVGSVHDVQFYTDAINNICLLNSEEYELQQKATYEYCKSILIKNEKLARLTFDS